MARHTQGPWRTRYGSGRDVEIVSDSVPLDITKLATAHASAEYAGTLPAEANARLMAAAPQLLAALVEARRLGVITLSGVKPERVEASAGADLMMTIEAAISAAGGE